jgi:hypothetical protein
METSGFLVHARTPTYKRPDMLRRALQSLQAQTHTNWICDVYDDDRDGAGRPVVEALADPRIRYTLNPKQNFASRNIDQCFTAQNPHEADYFCVVEDDNFLLPRFMEDNLRIAREQGVALILRNQLIELGSGTPDARLSEAGILDEMFAEGRYEPSQFRLSLIPGIGVSNGGLFWSRDAKSRLEIGYACTATLQEYLRTFSVWEDIYVAMDPLAVWAENGAQTTRDLGGTAGYLKRELDLKRAVQILQREAWALAGRDRQREFLESASFRYPAELRARGLVKALITTRTGTHLGLKEKLELAARGLLIRTAGRPEPELPDFIASRKAAA